MGYIMIKVSVMGKRSYHMEKDCCGNRKKVRSEEEKKAIITRLNRITGQLSGVKKMIEEDRYCEDVLIQLSAADKSIKSLAAYMLENHMRSCLVEQVQGGNTGAVDEIIDLFKRYQ